MRDHSFTHGSTYTESDMRSLAMSIQMYVEDSGKEMPNQLDEIIRILIENDEVFLENLTHNLPEDAMQGDFLDYWGRPIHLVVNSPSEYKLVSYGFNGKDDQGKQDDLVLVFNPQKVGEIEIIRW